ncbi:MAG: AMP-binding protein [Acidimicrobiales bacterium]
MTISYAAGATDIPLLGETISANLRRSVATYPTLEVLVDVVADVRLTYAEFDVATDELAAGLLHLEVHKGDRVGIWAPNVAEWVLLQYATAKIGAILVNINPAYRSDELIYALNQSQVSVLVTLERFKTSEYRQMVESSMSQLPALRRVLYIDRGDIAELRAVGRQQGFDEVVTVERTLDFDDPINIQYTSGTTGRPKGATLSHFNILNNGYFVGEMCHYTDADRICVPVPFYHTFGMVMGNLAATSHGATIVIPAPSFEPHATLAAVESERCTSLYGVPTMFIAELASEDFARFDLSSLRTGIMAGSPCPVEVMKRVVSDMHMEQVTIAYGMTETSPVSCQTRTSDPLDKRIESVGTVHPHVEVKIVDATGHVTERGVAGELLTRGYSVMLGYWDDDEKTALAIDKANWMHTGDVAIMDDDGYVYIVGRLKDMIIRGGENIYPREIEEFLYTHPNIRDVSVIGVPDPTFGEVTMAWIILNEGVETSEEEIREFCRGKISHHKIPQYIKFVDAFPMTVTGKIQKYLMRRSAEEELHLDGSTLYSTTPSP